MNGNVYLFWIILVFLTITLTFSKLLTNSKDGSDILPSKQNQLDKVKNNNILKSRHKYKLNDHKQGMHKTRFYRNERRPSPDFKGECAVMYRDQDPIGILQPFEKSYKLLPVSGERVLVEIDPDSPMVLSKSDVQYADNDYTDSNGELKEMKEQFIDEKYPSIFTQFKIDSKLEKNNFVNNKQSIVKRESLRPGIAKPFDNDGVQVKEELKHILDDMGLIDEEHDDEKRAIVKEDENLEEGTNRINLVKQESRNKRTETTVNNEETSTTNSDVKLREKRQKTDVDLDKKSKILRELQKAGTLKFSGNSSPLAYESESNSKLSEYEKRVERDIRNKIQALKQQVQHEIESLRGNSNVVDSSKVDSSSRRKRQALNTLIEAETGSLDPTLNVDDKLQPHNIRKRRAAQQTVNDNDLAKESKILPKLNVHFHLRKLSQYDNEDDENKENEARKRDIDYYEDDGNDSKFNEDKHEDCNENGGTCNDKNNDNNENSCNCGNNSKDCKDCHSTGLNVNSRQDAFDNTYDDDPNIVNINENNEPLSHIDSTFIRNRRRNGVSADDEIIDYSEGNAAVYNVEKRKAKEDSDALWNDPVEEGSRNNYFVDLHPDIYKLSPVLNGEIEQDDEMNPRTKRFVELEQLHGGGGPIKKHLVAIKSRSMFPQPHSRFRRRIFNSPKQQPQQLIDMSDEELFGALPQSFEGELARYKRVKRTGPNMNKNDM